MGRSENGDMTLRRMLVGWAMIVIALGNSETTVEELEDSRMVQSNQLFSEGYMAGKIAAEKGLAATFKEKIAALEQKNAELSKHATPTNLGRLGLSPSKFEGWKAIEEALGDPSIALMRDLIGAEMNVSQSALIKQYSESQYTRSVQNCNSTYAVDILDVVPHNFLSVSREVFVLLVCRKRLRKSRKKIDKLHGPRHPQKRPWRLPWSSKEKGKDNKRLGSTRRWRIMKHLREEVMKSEEDSEDEEMEKKHLRDELKADMDECTGKLLSQYMQLREPVYVVDQPAQGGGTQPLPIQLLEYTARKTLLTSVCLNASDVLTLATCCQKENDLKKLASNNQTIKHLDNQEATESKSDNQTTTQSGQLGERQTLRGKGKRKKWNDMLFLIKKLTNKLDVSKNSKCCKAQDQTCCSSVTRPGVGTGSQTKKACNQIKKCNTLLEYWHHIHSTCQPIPDAQLGDSAYLHRKGKGKGKRRPRVPTQDQESKQSTRPQNAQTNQSATSTQDQESLEALAKNLELVSNKTCVISEVKKSLDPGRTAVLAGELYNHGWNAGEQWRYDSTPCNAMGLSLVKDAFSKWHVEPTGLPIREPPQGSEPKSYGTMLYNKSGETRSGAMLKRFLQTVDVSVSQKRMHTHKASNLTKNQLCVSWYKLKESFKDSELRLPLTLMACTVFVKEAAKSLLESYCKKHYNEGISEQLKQCIAGDSGSIYGISQDGLTNQEALLPCKKFACNVSSVHPFQCVSYKQDCVERRKLRIAKHLAKQKAKQARGRGRRGHRRRYIAPCSKIIKPNSCLEYDLDNMKDELRSTMMRMCANAFEVREECCVNKNIELVPSLNFKEVRYEADILKDF